MISPLTVAAAGMAVAVGGSGVDVAAAGVSPPEVSEGSEQETAARTSVKIVAINFLRERGCIRKIIPKK